MKQMIKQLVKCSMLVSLMLVFFAGNAIAETYDVRGKTMNQIRTIYGEPISVKGPIGGYNSKRPPITEWDYGNFYITFERNIALHGNERDSLRMTIQQ